MFGSSEQHMPNAGDRKRFSRLERGGPGGDDEEEKRLEERGVLILQRLISPVKDLDSLKGSGTYLKSCKQRNDMIRVLF